MQRTWSAAQRLADGTPPERNRYVDFLRACSILVVVIGHWLMAAPELQPNGELIAGHVLAEFRWTQWLTWVFQVMPIFFMVGGYANAVSWRSARIRGDGYGRWLNARLRRLVLPVVPLIVIWTALGSGMLAVGFDSGLVRIGSQTALVPVWFLAVYVAVVALTPLALGLWDRIGWWSFGLGATAAVVVDVISINSGNDGIGWLNYLFVWGAVHQLGFAWRDGRLSGKTTIVWAGVGLGALAVLITVFGYPVSMVGVPGAETNNTLPPRLPLLALGVFQTGVLLGLEMPARRMLERGRAWTATVLVNTQIMTIYLWHLTAMVLLLAVLLWVGGLGLRLEAGSAAWWLTRPIWLAITALFTVPFLVGFSRFERPRTSTGAPSAWRGVAAVAAVCAGLAAVAYSGIGDASGMNWTGVTLIIGGAAVGGALTMPSPARS